MDRNELFDRWSGAWRALGDDAPSVELFERLVASWSEPHRSYHTLQHLGECFAHFELLRHLAQRPAEIEIALWFHDAIYATRRKDNEEQSAEWARSSVLARGCAADVAERVHALVMATRHAAAPVGVDAEILVDVDLAILGAEPARFDEYERQIREEYPWVPGLLYRRERRKVLREFAGRPTLFRTEPFRQAFEARARKNLARSLGRL